MAFNALCSMRPNVHKRCGARIKGATDRIDLLSGSNDEQLQLLMSLPPSALSNRQTLRFGVRMLGEVVLEVV